MIISAPHLQALQKITARLEGSAALWVVTGSFGMALQGVPLEARDIDLQTDESGAYEIERLMAEYVVQPVRYRPSEKVRSHFGVLEIEGVTVEIMGDMQKLLDDLTWETPVRLADFRQWVEVSGLRVPVLSLEYEVQAYERLGRTERAEMLRAWLRQNKGGHL